MMENEENVKNEKKPEYNKTAAIKKAVQNRDFDSWTKVVQDMPQGDKLLNVISEEEFELLIDLHNSKKELWRKKERKFEQKTPGTHNGEFKEQGGEDVYKVYNGGYA